MTDQNLTQNLGCVSGRWNDIGDLLESELEEFTGIQAGGVLRPAEGFEDYKSYLELVFV